MLGFGLQAVWRAQSAARHKGRELEAVALKESEELEQVADRLNRHGFELQHSAQELTTRLQRWSAFFNQPLLVPSLRWLLRRLFQRPLKKQG